MIAAFGKPVSIPDRRAKAAVLELLGSDVDPDQTVAFLYADDVAAMAWQAATYDHHGIRSLGIALTDAGPVGVYDVRLESLPDVDGG